MEALVVGLVLWINQHSCLDYDIRHGIPAVRQAAHETLIAVIIEDHTDLDDKDDAKSFQGAADKLVAVYDHRKKEILISSKIDMKSPYARSVIVHELVHYIQYQRGMNRKVDCLNALEKDAYNIQACYMDAHNIPKTFNDITVALRSTCWESVK